MPLHWGGAVLPSSSPVLLSGPWLVLLEYVSPAGKDHSSVPSFLPHVRGDVIRPLLVPISPSSDQVTTPNLSHALSIFILSPYLGSQVVRRNRLSEAEIRSVIKTRWPRDVPVSEPTGRDVASATVAQGMSVGLSVPGLTHIEEDCGEQSWKQQIILHSQCFPQLLPDCPQEGNPWELKAESEDRGGQAWQLFNPTSTFLHPG